MLLFHVVIHAGQSGEAVTLPGLPYAPAMLTSSVLYVAPRAREASKLFLEVPHVLII